MKSNTVLRTRVLTFAAVPAGARSGKQVRQYRERRGAAWRILDETELG